MHKKGISLNSVEKSLCQSADKIRRKILLFRKYLVSKSFKQKRGEASRFCRKSFISQYRKISLGNISVYQKISGSEKFYASERGGYQVSSSKTFCHTVPKNFVREHFGVSENFVHHKILCTRRGYP